MLFLIDFSCEIGIKYQKVNKKINNEKWFFYIMQTRKIRLKLDLLRYVVNDY